MKVNIKSIKYLCILFISIFILGVAGSVDADTIAFHLCNNEFMYTKDYYNDTRVNSGTDETVSKPVSLEYIEPSGNLAYCSELGVGLNLSGSLPQVNYSVYSTSENNYMMLARIMTHGYNTKTGANVSSCIGQEERIATQMLIHIYTKNYKTNGVNHKNWKSYTESDIKSFFDLSQSNAAGVDKIAKAFVKIRDAVIKEENASKLNLTPTSVELKYDPTTHNWKGTVTDSAGVLLSGEWKISNSGNITAVIANASTINLSDADGVPASGTVSLSNTFSTSKVYVSAYTNPDRPNESNDDYQQTIWCEPSNETRPININYAMQKIGKGTIQLTKVEKGTNFGIPGIEFGLYSDATCQTVAKDYLGKDIANQTTNENGYIEWKNLYYPLGGTISYYVKEKVPEGYALDPEVLSARGAKNGCIPIEISTKDEPTKENKVVGAVISNIPYGNITIMKRNALTGEVVEGVEFRLLQHVPNAKDNPAEDVNGKVVENVKTGKNGVAEFKDIPYGDYILEEVSVDGSYKILKEPVEFTLNADNDSLKFKDKGLDFVVPEGEETVPLETYRLGDLNDDEIIDNNDVTIVEAIIAGTEANPTDKMKAAADVNKDGNVNEQDKELMLSYIDGKVEAIEGALGIYPVPGQYQKRVTIVVTDVPVDIKISKFAISKSEELPGAKIEIKNSNGKLYESFTSTKERREFYIVPGDYTLTEVASPKGYEKLETEIKFNVDNEGQVKILSAKSKLYELKQTHREYEDVNGKQITEDDLDHLVIYNNAQKIIIPDTASTIAIIGVVLGVGLIGFGGYEFYKRYKMAK